MTDDLVKRLRDRVARTDKPWATTPAMCAEAADRIEELERELTEERYSREAAADKAREFLTRIEELETLVSYVAGMNEDHVTVMLGGNPIVCKEIISKARTALEGKND